MIMLHIRHLKFAAKFLLNRFRKIHPFEIQAYVTTACNQKCSFCLCPEVKKDSMTTEQWKEIIHRLGSLGALRLKFQGGEPTLRRDFRELSKESQASGMITAAVSNGIMLVKQPELLDYLDELVVSLDSSHKSVNDSIRGKGAYEAAVKALDLAQERRIRTFVNMVLIRENRIDIEDMLAFCESKGTMLNIQPAMFDRKYFPKKDLNLALTNDEIRELHIRLADWKRQGRGLIFSAWSYQKAADWPEYDIYTNSSKGLSSCVAGNSYYHIEPDGDVHPCGHHGADFSPKNIIRDGFEEAFLHAQKHNCGDCWLPFMNERKATFGLKLFAIRETLSRN